MNRIDRLLGIVTLLQSRKYVSAEKIAEKYRISIRTVYRDVKALGEQGIPIGFEPGKGYFVMNEFFLPPVSFTTDEASALMLMEHLVNVFGDKSIQKHYSSALSKINAVLRGPQKETLESLNSQIKTQFPACIVPGYEYLTSIQQAITARTMLELDYTNTNNIASKRKVEPIGLIFYALNWHLIAWCHSRKEYRDFRVSRIKQLRCLQTPFTITEHIPLAEYMKELPVAY